MIVEVLTYFADADDFTKRYEVGEIIEIADVRADELIRLGIVKPKNVKSNKKVPKG